MSSSYTMVAGGYLKPIFFVLVILFFLPSSYQSLKKYKEQENENGLGKQEPAHLSQTYWKCDFQGLSQMQTSQKRLLTCFILVEGHNEIEKDKLHLDIQNIKLASTDYEIDLFLYTYWKKTSFSEMMMKLRQSIQPSSNSSKNYSFINSQQRWNPTKIDLTQLDTTFLKSEAESICTKLFQVKSQKKQITKNQSICGDLCQICENQFLNSGNCNLCVKGATFNERSICQCVKYQVQGENRCVDFCPRDYFTDSANRICTKQLSCNLEIQTKCISCQNQVINSLEGGESVVTTISSKNLNSEQEFNQTTDIFKNEKLSDKLNFTERNLSKLLEAIFTEIKSSYSEDQSAKQSLQQEQFDRFQTRNLEITNQFSCSFESNPDCLVCDKNQACQICKSNYYNFNGQCYTELKLINYSDEVKLCITIAASCLLGLSLIISIIASLMKIPNSIFLFTSQAMQKIFFLSLISVGYRIQTSDLFSAFQYLCPLSLSKSTSLINYVFKSNQEQNYINYVFNYNGADANIIFSSSGFLLLGLYALAIYYLFSFLCNKNIGCAQRIYQSFSCGIIYQLLAQSVQILCFGVALQIMYFLVSHTVVKDYSLFPVQIVILVVSCVFVVGILFFFYTQTKNPNTNQSVNAKGDYYFPNISTAVFLCNCFCITWIQKNYNLIIVIKESLILPIIIVFLKDSYKGQMIGFVAAEAAHFAILLYSRPYKSMVFNIQQMISKITWVILLIIKFIYQIQLSKLQFSENALSQSNTTLTLLRDLEIIIISLFFFDLVSLQTTPLIMYLRARKAEKDSLQPLIQQIDSFTKIQLSPYGYYRENPTMFKVRDSQLTEQKLAQNYKNFRGSGRFSVSTMMGNSQCGVSQKIGSLNVSPDLSPVKVQNILRSRNSDNDIQIRKQSSSIFLNNSVLNIINNNNNILGTEINRTQKKSSTSTIPVLTGNECSKPADMDQISELKEELYTDNNQYNTMGENKLHKTNIFIPQQTNSDNHNSHSSQFSSSSDSNSSSSSCEYTHISTITKKSSLHDSFF